MRRPYNCECGGIRSLCEALGKHSIGHYTFTKPPTGSVVWNGTMQREGTTAIELVSDREERIDSRLDSMPTYDLDDGEVDDIRPKRKYNRTGNHVGKCSRTNPNAPQYIPRHRPEQPVILEETNG